MGVEATPPQPDPERRASDPPRAPLALELAQRLWSVTKARFSPTERQRLFGLTILIGGVCGLVAVAFHEGITWFASQTVDRGFAAPGHSWVPWVIVIPTVGALAAGVMLYVIPGARGSGIPQIKVAYALSAAKLKITDSIGKFFIGVVQIGSGSSLGREGPTVQICSGVAKGIGQLAGVSAQNLKLLLPVGAAAGIAAAFNAPIAAVTFTIEEIVGNLDQTLLSGVIVAAALAAVVERSVLGEHPVFSIPTGYSLDHASSLILYAALGISAALISVAFTESLLRLRKRFNAMQKLALWARPAIGGLVTGVLAVAVMLIVHESGITGGGYGALGDALSGDLGVEVLLVMGAAKLVATVFSYASGGAGGIFAPSLFMGAMLGGAFGALDVYLFGHPHSEVGSFALVGMGAVFAGVVRAPITSVLIIIEMTAGYGLTLPLMISNMVAYGVARQLRPTPIYEALLEQDGVQLRPKKPQGDAIDRLTIGRIKLDPDPHAVFAPTEHVARVLEVGEAAGRQDVFPVVDAADRLVGIITLDDVTLLAAEPDLDGLIRATDVMQPAVALGQGELATRALELMLAMGVRELPVVDAEQRVLGFIDEAEVAREFMRVRAAERAEAAASGVRPAMRDDG